MRRRQQPQHHITIAGTAIPLPPPSAAATRSEVSALGDQVGDLREHFEMLARSLRESVAELAARTITTEAHLTSSLEDRVARLSVDHDVAISEVEVRLTGQMEAATAAQHHSLESLATRFDDAAQQIATQVAAQEQRVAEQAERLRHEVTASVDALRSDVERSRSEAMETQSRQLAEVREELVSMNDANAGARNELQEQLSKVVEQAASTAFTMMQLKDRMAEIDVDALDHMRERVTTLAGETTLVRIEMDRLTGNIDDRFDRLQLRLTEVESMVESDADVSMAVQSERLDEMERALAELNPDRFVTKGDLEHGATGALHAVPNFAAGGE